MALKPPSYLDTDLEQGRDFFAFFEIPRENFNRASLKIAFQQKVKDHHPDQYQDKSAAVLRNHSNMMQKATRGRKILSNDSLRKEYMDALDNAAKARRKVLQNKVASKANRRNVKTNPCSANNKIDPATYDNDNGTTPSDDAFNQPYREPRSVKRKTQQKPRGLRERIFG